MTALIADPAEDTSPDDVGAIVLASIADLPSAHRRLIRLLSVAVSCTAAELERAHRAVWPDVPLSSTVLQSFLGLALVESVGSRYRVLPPADVRLAREWRETEVDEFDRAHREFAEIERGRRDEGDIDEYEEWQVKARLAYYLSAVSEQASLQQYAEAFDSPPEASRLACRLWLAALADRFADIAGVESRVSRFFSAFRSYVAGNRELSAPAFRSLVEDDRTDQITAISSHLLALCLNRRDLDHRLGLLRSSVQMSADLGLSDNLLMSRNTLAWSLVSAVRSGGDAALLTEAGRVAQENDRLADALGVALYQTATRYAHAIVGWYAEVGLRPTMAEALRHRSQADRGFHLLDEARRFAEQASDLGAWVNASIGAAQIHRYLGDAGRALAELDAAVAAMQATKEFGELPVRQFHDELDRLVAQAPEMEGEASRVRSAFVRVLRHHSR